MARGPASKGLHYCEICGKRGRSLEFVQQHIHDVHGGFGSALREPSRATLLATYRAAQDVVECYEHWIVDQYDREGPGEAIEDMRKAMRGVE